MDDSSFGSKKGADPSPTNAGAGLLRSSEDSGLSDELAWIQAVEHSWTPSRIPSVGMSSNPSSGSVLKLAGCISLITLQSLSFGYAQAIPFQGPANRDYGTTILIICQLLGSIFASLVSPFFSDRYGRRSLLLANNYVMLLGAMLCCSPYVEALRSGSGKLQYQIGRFGIGCALGVAHMTVPVLLAEIAPPRWRGSITVCHQLVITVGILISKVILFVAGNKDDDIDGCHCVDDRVLQWMHIALVIPPVLQLLASGVMPESPRLLLRRDGVSSAAEELARLRPSQYPPQDAEDELNGMVEELQAENKQASLFSELMAHHHQMWIAGVLLMLNALTGINTWIYWGDAILVAVGDAGSLQVLLPSANSLFTLVPILVIDRVGRTKLLQAGTLLMAVAMCALGAMLMLQTSTGPVSNAIGVVLMLAFTAGFAVGLGGIPWVVVVEIFPTKMRQTAIGLWMSLNWASNIAITESFRQISQLAEPPTTDQEGRFDDIHLRLGAAFVGLGLISAVGYVVVRRSIPETRGPSLVI